jgi:hypothetical protein
LATLLAALASLLRTLLLLLAGLLADILLILLFILLASALLTLITIVLGCHSSILARQPFGQGGKEFDAFRHLVSRNAFGRPVTRDNIVERIEPLWTF